MGQKANSLGVRLPITKDWHSRWFAGGKKNYAKNLLEDFKIRKFLMEKLKLAGIVRVQIDRFINKMKITLYVSRPGIVIGRGGSGLELLKKELCQMVTLTQPEKNLELEDIVQIENPDLEAFLVASRVAEQLEKRLPYRRVITKTIERTMNAGAKGIKVIISGRVAGAEISRREKFGDQGKTGTIPAQTLRADIDFAGVPAFTRSGYIGVKVWIYRGEKE